jgi:peptide/nickel transport system permease protein
MIRLILIRIAIAVGTLLAVSALMFWGIQALPGDAAQSTLKQFASKERLAVLRHDYGLDRPALTRYEDWLSNSVQGDFGSSLTAQRPVSDVVKDNVRNTAILTTVVLLILIPLGLVLGILSALWRGRSFDHGTAVATLGLVATPEFVAGSLLVVLFASILGIFPATSLLDSSKSPLSQLNVLVLPALTLILVSVAQLTRMVRATMIEILETDYIRSAVLRGVPRGRIVLRHALPNAIDANLQIVAQTIGYLIGGVVITEALFQYPGMGVALTTAVQTRDIPTVLALTMIVTVAYVLANLLAEIATILLNPRLRRSSRTKKSKRGRVARVRATA